MKTSAVGILGTALTVALKLTSKEWSEVAAAFAGFGTGVYMVLKCIDWLIGKIVAKRARKRKNRG